MALLLNKKITRGYTPATHDVKRICFQDFNFQDNLTRLPLNTESRNGSIILVSSLETSVTIL